MMVLKALEQFAQSHGDDRELSDNHHNFIRLSQAVPCRAAIVYIARCDIGTLVLQKSCCHSITMEGLFDR